MEHKTKEFLVEYKDEGSGVLEGYASTWIKRPDSYGDIVKAGAFTESLANRWKGGKNIPLLWAHQMDNLDAYIGLADANEDEKGLHFVAKFDDTQEAQRVRGMYKDGRLSKFSFAYDVLEAGPLTLEDGTKVNELRKLDIYEISCVLVPANDDAGVVDVKADATVTNQAEEITEPEVKAGRRNSAKDAEALKQAIELIQGVLGVFDDIEEAEEDEPTKGEDEPEANAPEAEEQKASNPKKDDLLAYIKEREAIEK